MRQCRLNSDLVHSILVCPILLRSILVRSNLVRSSRTVRWMPPPVAPPRRRAAWYIPSYHPSRVQSPFRRFVAAANRAIAEAINAGFVHHANALRNIGSAAFETSKRSGGDTKALKSGFLEYAKGAQEQDARMREARLLNAPQRTQRTAWRAVLPGSPSPTSHIVLRLFMCVQVSSWWGK